MSVVQPPAKILVTGANGFIAIWIVQYLLDQGYNVRGAVRTEAKAQYLEKQFAPFGKKLECVVIDDMTKPGAFDDAVKGMDGVIHTAAPVHFQGTYETMIKPSVDIVNSLFTSVKTFGKDVKRVVMTSSASAVLQPHEPGYVYSEKDWNDFVVQVVQAHGNAAPPAVFYPASKTLSERAAWDFVKEHKDEIKWELTTLVFPYAFGPILHEVGDPLEASFLYRSLLEEKPKELLTVHAGQWIDVRDVAIAHILSLQKEKAGNERIAFSAGPLIWQDIYDVLGDLRPAPIKKGEIQEMRAEADFTKATEILGLKYRTLEESVKDTVSSVQERQAQKN